MPAYTGYMAVGYTALLLDLDTQRMLREAYGATPAAALPVITPRIVDKLDAYRADKRVLAPVVNIVGVHESDQVKVLLLEVAGTMVRPDGGFYNIVMAVPERGLHMRTVDELAQAVLSRVPEALLRNHIGAVEMKVNPAYVIGVERPQAMMPEARPQVAAKAPLSRFMRAG